MSTAIATQIPADEIRFHALSSADPGGRVFWWQDELYRGIPSARVDHYRDLFDRGIIQRLIDEKLLVETEITDLDLAPYEMVLKHRTVPFVTYAAEWPGAMLRDTAILLLNIQEVLLAEGLMLHDAHPWNVLFDGVKPVFVDIGSIIPLARGGHWPAIDEFRRFFIHPLKAMAAGHARVARWLLHDNHRGMSATEAAALCGEPAPQPAPKLSAAEALTQARAELKQLAPQPVKTEWWNYSAGKGDFPDLNDRADWNEKRRCVARLLAELQPTTMLDIGSNRGWFSQLAARAGTNVLATDVDETSLNLLHADAVASGLPIQPLMMDFGNPMPGYGIHNSCGEPAMKRLRCDLVLALAVVHHMTHKQFLRFEQIADGLATLSNRWVITEFIAREDIHVARWPKGPDWYNLENFVSELRKHFRTVQQFPSELEHRWILFCEK